ncbi:MAG: bifunctional N(6)-L-threonylcarbamoyladenine synthase/serine/threonine protein kinase [Candidatus Altiarchaeales archaeon]|nr:bifunctional N(6)-L-threonylcarbamoyladenine synthase/serine/threonine protein kinase [Candidatus Altiarchaeales archaeon]MBD3415601.1 bifunctional N(6)-L-threonylcarbamoyladenine synthase/serine/threonine protein kinase [Candidatus Altiarchaeales archaeon]
MIVLGLEGTAHTLGVGVIDGDFNVLADVRNSYTPEDGGIHPRDASQHMSSVMRESLDQALDEAAITISDVGLVSFSQGPGLGPCLRTVATAARTLALYNKKPLLGVNHCIAHIEVGKVLSGFTDPLVLYVSGANSQVIKLRDGRYRVFGETLDVGLGNMLDKFGRMVGLQHPAGPKIEELAREGSDYIELPYVVKGTDMSFSGILTAAYQKHESGARLEDICHSLQETSFAMLCEVTERALAHLKAGEVLLAGGVGYNKRLQQMASLVAEEHGASFDYPGKFMGDQGVMIAMTALKMHDAGVTMTVEDSVVDSSQRTDSIDVTW